MDSKRAKIPSADVCWSSFRCDEAKRMDALNDDLAEHRRPPDYETKRALVFCMASITTGRCPACGRLVR